MKTEFSEARLVNRSLPDELVITQEVIQGLLEMLGAAWEEVDQMRARVNSPA